MWYILIANGSNIVYHENYYTIIINIDYVASNELCVWPSILLCIAPWTILDYVSSNTVTNLIIKHMLLKLEP